MNKQINPNMVAGILIDHTLSRLERGLAGYLLVEGDETPTIFHEGGSTGTSGG